MRSPGGNSLRGWEGNRRSGVAQAVCVTGFRGLTVYRGYNIQGREMITTPTL